MEKYYLIHGSLFENIGHETLRCIASTSKRKIGVMIMKPDLNKPWVIPIASKEEGVYLIQQDAYFENETVFEAE